MTAGVREPGRDGRDATSHRLPLSGWHEPWRSTVIARRPFEGRRYWDSVQFATLGAPGIWRLHRARTLLQTWIDQQLGEDVRRLYQFDGQRCDRIVRGVLARLAPR